MVTRALFILALIAGVAFALPSHSRGNCKCRRTRDRFGPPRAIEDIQIYPASPSCDKMEIVVSLKIGVQYCLDPRVKKVQELVKNLQSRYTETTAPPEDGSTNIWGSV
ncbi:hypothetical protein GJAV_G00195340 [Gymnothorax javanicus]|nr:hypothetical protein GJAV_G00195340 [Gymnothorax javanicus]